MSVLWMCTLAFYSFILFCAGRKILVFEVFISCQLLPAWFFFPENKLTSNIILEICCCTQIFFLKWVESGLPNTFFSIASSVFVYQVLKLTN